MVELIPLLCWLALVSNRQFAARWHRLLFLGAGFTFWFAQIFLLFTEFFFFDEFKSRFNTVAVDYLENPREVLINIWESYHVALLLLACLGLTLLWMWVARRLFGGMWEAPVSRKSRVLHLAGAAALAAVLVPSINIRGARVGSDRTVNEIANNGAVSFFAAAWTHHIDYADFYKTMPLDEAYDGCAGSWPRRGPRSRRRAARSGAEWRAMRRARN